MSAGTPGGGRRRGLAMYLPALTAAVLVAACASSDPVTDSAPAEAAPDSTSDTRIGYGEACLDGSSCGALECVTALDGLKGQIAGGACLARCDANETCPEDTLCVGGACLSECFPGVSGGSSCDSRHDVACTPTDALATRFVCMPLCNSDADCSAGLHCQPQTGLCDTPIPQGSPTGEPCVPGSSSCAGACLDAFGAGIGVCTQPCSFGARDACPGAECLVMTPGPTQGDLGVCALPCVRHEDCQDASQFCFAGGCFVAAPCDAGRGCGTFLGAPLECLSPEGSETSVCIPGPA